ncbi:Zn-dependent exopeptidase [Leucogyrophana mollusca]|uniref:Zn-dependent exopeptidase n=1 Tax=Leucogyrophana mollusca TaxID=85980 RepID=A0ACB8BZJ6_9AGAM|nr:Zn-dependent exopeptidase [Leucogyrophana mollusca]
MDEKSSNPPVDTKSASDSEFIPVPVTHRPRLSSTHRRVRVWGRWIVILASLGTIHLWNQSNRYALVPNPRGCGGVHDQWMVDAFVPGHPPKKGHRILRGKKAEELFLSVPNSASALAASHKYATQPHMAGTAGDLDTAKEFLSLLQRELGVHTSSDVPIFAAGSNESRNSTLSVSSIAEPAAWIDEYYPILNTPLERQLEILGEDGKVVWSAQLEEVADETDPDAHKYAETIPTWHGISRGGEAKGKLVYAHYGRKEDYDALVEAGVDFKDKIVITRYGGIFRGLKVKRAQELGAAAVLIYSDLRDDGTVTVENGYAPYPHGPARNPTSVQRGSVQFLSIYAGDPSTPGYPSYENSTRTEGWSKPSIPSLPISWANAQVLLKETEEGGEGRTIRLNNQVDERITPIWNTLGVIPGHIKDEVVVLGATDPSSGTVAMHEAIRGFGALLREGWKPLRTILIASWDGEEYGLIGSTEWGEDFAPWIDQHVVAYVNIDSSTSGSHLGGSASPLLAHLLRDTAEAIPHPTKEGRTLWDARSDTGTLFGEHINPEIVAMHEEELMAADSLGVNPLGSGSDYTVFLQHIGVPSTDGGFKSTLHDPVYHYHSVFDSQRWQELYGDPGFSRHVAIAKHIGLQVLRLSGNIVLPLNTTHYSYELEKYLENVERIASKQSLDINFASLRESLRALQSASEELDAEKAAAEHQLKKVIKGLRKRHAIRRRIHRKIHKGICKLKKILKRKCESEDTGEEAGKHGGRGFFGHPSRRLIQAIKRVQAVNYKLAKFERGFISEEGIKDREWYKHLAVAPGKWLGYGATTLPGLTESITLDKNITATAHEAQRLKDLVDALVGRIQV